MLKRLGCYVFIGVLEGFSFGQTTPEQVQNNLKETFLLLGQEGGHEVQSFGKSIRSVYGNSPAPDFNIILGFPAELAQEDLKNALVYAKKKPLPFLFVTEPKGDSAAKQKLLAQFSFSKVAEVTRMSIEHEQINWRSESSQIREVADAKMLETFCLLSDEANGFESGTSAKFFGPLAKYLGRDFAMKFYIAFTMVKGKEEPVAVAALHLPANKNLLAGHYAWGVKPAHRKKGIMTSLVKHMITIAKERGYPASVAQCYDSSLRLAERLGFKQQGNLDIYTNANM